MIYFSDDGDVLGVRVDHWKVVFTEQRCAGTLQVRFEPFTRLRAPKLFNLRTDPYERADITSNTYWDWFMERDFLAFYAQALVVQFLDTFKDFPPRQKAASFTINHAVDELNAFLASRGG
jgi:arylsulfatase